MAQHHRFTVATDVAVYFCDPRSPWQRGTYENINGPLRQYSPDGTDLSVFTQRDLNRVAKQLNTRLSSPEMFLHRWCTRWRLGRPMKDRVRDL